MYRGSSPVLPPKALASSDALTGFFTFKAMIKLRDNQIEPHKIAVDFFKKEKAEPSIIVAPTAFGKSVLVAKILIDIPDKVLILQPSKELLAQNFEKYTLCGGQASIYSASFGSKQIGKVTFATIGSIKEIGKTFREHGFTKMIIDEVHLYPRNSDSMIGKFLEDSGITHVLGLTATPFKIQQNTDMMGNKFSKLVMLTSSSKHGNFYKDILYVSQVQEMTKLNFWSNLTYEMNTETMYELEWNSSKSDFTEESVQRAYEITNTFDKIRNVISRNLDRKKIIVFVPSVADAIRLSKITPNAAAVWGEMDKKDRARVIDAFKFGTLRVVYNVSVLSVGFDSPNIDWIILGRDFGNLSTYYQIVGRGTRIMEGKRDCLITDFGKNIQRFGKVEELVFGKEKRTWKLFGEGGKLLTGLPMHEIGTIARDESVAVNDKHEEEKEGVMTFGKHKGELIKDVPISYLKWCIENVTWNKWNNQTKKDIEKFLKSVRNAPQNLVT